MRVGRRYKTPRRLLTFALDGRAALPSVAKPDLTVYAVDDPNIKIDPAEVAAGEHLAGRCRSCHGGNLASAGSAPDLRESQIALHPDSLWAVIHDGVLIQNGMPRFDSITHEQMMQLFAFIRAQARKALAQNATEAKPGTE